MNERWVWISRSLGVLLAAVSGASSHAQEKSRAPFFTLEALACLDEMRAIGHAGFSYSASLDAFLVEGARAGRLGFYYAPVAPSRGTSFQPRVYFLDGQLACPEERVKRRAGNQVGICVVQALAATQPVEFVLNVYPDRYRGFASRPHHSVGRAIANDQRFALPETTAEEATDVAMARAMRDWFYDRHEQMKYFQAVLDPNGRRGAERTPRLVETARSLVSSLGPLVRVCGTVQGSGLQSAMKPVVQSLLVLKEHIEDADRELVSGSARKPAGFAP